MPSRPRKRDQTRYLAKLKSGHYPSWGDLFAEDDFQALAKLCGAKSDPKKKLLRNRLPITVARYIRTRESEPETALSVRRRKLDQIKREAHKLRQRILELNGPARLDLLSTASRYTGNTTSVDPFGPDQWFVNSGNLIRDIGVAAGAASDDLKRLARRGGRPTHMAERLLIWDLAMLYRQCSNGPPGYRGRFPRFVRHVFILIDPAHDNSGLDHLLKEIVPEFNAEFEE